MKCPYCGEVDSKVIDSRPTEDGEKIRRRRECLNCKKRFTTYEIVETVPLMVVKKDRSREVFDRQKLLNGMLRACEKRPVSYTQLDAAVTALSSSCSTLTTARFPPIHIGDLAMQELKQMDDVAYVRFASVYRQFSDVNTFMEELKDMLDSRSKPAENDCRTWAIWAQARCVSISRSARLSASAQGGSTAIVWFSWSIMLRRTSSASKALSRSARRVVCA